MRLFSPGVPTPWALRISHDLQKSPRFLSIVVCAISFFLAQPFLWRNPQPRQQHPQRPREPLLMAVPP